VRQQVASGGVVEVAVGFTISTARMTNELMRGGLSPRCGGMPPAGDGRWCVTTLAPVTAQRPAAVRGAGLIVAVQGVAALVVAAIWWRAGLRGADQHIVNGLGHRGLVLAGRRRGAGRRTALVARKRLGAGWPCSTQLLLLPVAWYLAVGSHRPAFGIPVAIVALGTLILLSVRGRALGRRRGSARSGQSDIGSRDNHRWSHRFAACPPIPSYSAMASEFQFSTAQDSRV